MEESSVSASPSEEDVYTPYEHLRTIKEDSDFFATDRFGARYSLSIHTLNLILCLLIHGIGGLLNGFVIVVSVLCT